MKRDDTKKNFTSLSGNDLQTVRLHYPSFPCIIAIVPVSRLLNLMRYSSVLNANIRFFCSENRNFTVKNKGNCYSLILFSVLRSFAKIRIFFIHPYTFVMQNLWIFCICTLICITLCFICSDSYVM